MSRYGLQMDVRRATESDAEAIRAIYNREVLETTVTFDLVPRTLEEQRQYIAARSGALCVLVAEDQGTVAGFASLSFYRDRPAYRTSVENSIYTHRDYRGQGVGDLLMASLVERATASGFHSVFARIADAQAPSLSLHTKYGFELVGIEREVGRKFNRWLDVALMQLLLDPAT
ncbi:MAG: N-acetyltransferase family protein [Acidimicrobiales bacterium]